MWQKHPANDYIHQLMDGHVSQPVVCRYRMQIYYPQLQALSGAQGNIRYILQWNKEIVREMEPQRKKFRQPEDNKQRYLGGGILRLNISPSLAAESHVTE